MPRHSTPHGPCTKRSISFRHRSRPTKTRYVLYALQNAFSGNLRRCIGPNAGLEGRVPALSSAAPTGSQQTPAPFGSGCPYDDLIQLVHPCRLIRAGRSALSVVYGVFNPTTRPVGQLPKRLPSFFYARKTDGNQFGLQKSLPQAQPVDLKRPRPDLPTHGRPLADR